MAERPMTTETTQISQRIVFGPSPPSATARARAARMHVKALALKEVEDATAKLEAAKTEQIRAMEYAASVRCSLRQIGDAAGMSFSGVRSRLNRGRRDG